jgi:ribosomal protein S25
MMTPTEVAYLKGQAMLVVTNNPSVTPETIANHLGITIDVAEMLVRQLIKEKRLKMNPKV